MIRKIDDSTVINSDRAKAQYLHGFIALRILRIDVLTWDFML